MADCRKKFAAWLPFLIIWLYSSRTEKLPDRKQKENWSGGEFANRRKTKQARQWSHTNKTGYKGGKRG
jgi:hypothetical protein